MNETKKDVGKFVSLEKNLSLFNRSYNGFYYWQYVRFYVCESLFGNRIDNYKKENLKRKKIIEFLKEVIIALFQAAKTLIYVSKKKEYDIIFLREVVSSDRFFDSWKKPSNISILNMRITPYIKDSKNDFLFLEWPRIKTKITQEIVNRFNLRKLDRKEKVYLLNLEKKLQNEFGQSVSADEIEQAIINSKIEAYYYKKFYKWLYKKTKCKTIAVVCYYTNCLFPAYQVAKNMGIKVFEFQHGVINNHEEYWFEDNRGINNYTPDFLLTFGDIHNSWIKLVNNSVPVSIGYPYQEKCIDKLKEILPDEKLIVIYPESDSRFEKTLDSFVNKAVLKGYRVIMKLHPLQAEHVSLYYPLLSLNKNIKIVTKNNSLGVYYWLKKAKHHIMASTTVGLEAVAFDHVNICISLDVPHDQTQCLIDWGVARGFSSDEELMKLVLSPLDNKDKIGSIRTQLWKPNARENMTSLFSKKLCNFSDN